jgi:type VI secretion system secreted protein Hcp
MSSDCFLKLRGVSGEAADKDHPDEIEVVGWDWGVSGSQMAPGTGRHGDTQKLVITHKVDAATPTLMIYCLRGTIIPVGVLTMRKASGERPLPYFVAKLDRVRVADVTTGLRPGGETHEVFSLTFEKVEVTYTPQTPSGSGDASVTQQWDIKEGF